MLDEAIKWDDLLEIEDFTHEELIKSIEDIRTSENKSKESAMKDKAKDFDFGEKINVDDFENILKNTSIAEENKSNKFPQANNINLAILTLEIIINESSGSEEDDGRTSEDIATLIGFTKRQGGYYGDLLVYLGFLVKSNKKYFPTNYAMSYKKETDRKKRNMILLESMIRHKTIRDFFIMFHSSAQFQKNNLNNKLIDLLREDDLLKGFKDSTIIRRSSTIKAMAIWSQKIIEIQPKPFVKWAGGKQRIIEQLLNLAPSSDSYSKYIEPFAGGAAMFYSIKKKNSILNDYNQELINVYKQIKVNVDGVIDELNKLENTEKEFYRIRNIDRNPHKYEQLTNIEKAARFIFLNKTCFNGLYRVNKNGEFNTPYGHNSNAMFKTFELLKVNSNLYNDLDIKFYSGDYESVLSFADNDTFVYLDPPYDPVSETSNFTAYTNNGFDKLEQERLKKVVDSLTLKGVKVMISNSNTEYIRNLYNVEGYKINEIEVFRNIASNKNSRKIISELVITNY